MQPSITNAMSRGDLQKQLSSVLVAIKSQGYKIEDVIADEVRNHLPGLVELDSARVTITELEAREQSLKALNDEFSIKLKTKEAEILDQPGDLASLAIELQQATRRFEIFKELAENANKRADRYQTKMEEALRNQTAADSVSANLNILQNQIRHQEIAHEKLLREHNAAAEATEQQRERYQHAFNTQQAHLQSNIDEKDTQLTAAREEISRIETEALAISDAHTSLIDTLEVDHASVSAAVNTKTMQLRQTAMLHDALHASLTPLNAFFGRAVEILDVYQTLFQKLSNPTCPMPPCLPRSLSSTMQLAADDLLAYQCVKKVARVDGTGDQLEAMAAKAGLMFEYLDVIQNDATKFLGRQHVQPRTVSSNGGIASRMKRFSMG